MLLAQFTSNVLNTDTAISPAGNLHQSNIVITSASQAIPMSTVSVHQLLRTHMFWFAMVFQLYIIFYFLPYLCCYLKLHVTMFNVIILYILLLFMLLYLIMLKVITNL